MKHKFFKIAANDPAPAEEALNAFCSQHTIVTLEKELVMDGANSFWAFCVTWTDNEGGTAAPFDPAKQKSRVDYKKVLNDDDFTLYVQLRDLRKAISEREATAPYNVFTNEQLAEMVLRR